MDWKTPPDIVKEIPWKTYVDTNLAIFRGKSDMEVFNALLSYNIPINCLINVILAAFWDHNHNLMAKIQLDLKNSLLNVQELKKDVDQLKLDATKTTTQKLLQHEFNQRNEDSQKY